MESFPFFFFLLRFTRNDFGFLMVTLAALSFPSLVNASFVLFILISYLEPEMGKPWKDRTDFFSAFCRVKFIFFCDSLNLCFWMFFIQLEVVGRGGCVRILLVFMPLMISLEISWSFFPQTPRPDLDLPSFRGADFNWCEQVAFKPFL